MTVEWAAQGAAGIKEHGMRAEFTAFEILQHMYRHMCYLLDIMHIVRNLGALLHSSITGTWNMITLPD